jgi:hypothetical protein
VFLFFRAFVIEYSPLFFNHTRRTGIGIWHLPFDVAQGGESFDVAQDHEPVEWPVERFFIWVL